MSAIVILPVLIPGAVAAWPVIAAAAAAAAAALGYAAGRPPEDVKEMTEVELTVAEAESVVADMALGEELVFVKGDVQVAFVRDAGGGVSVKVRGVGKTEEELRVMGQQMAGALTQQYAYHKIVTELKERNLDLVEEEVDEDGTVRLHVRVYQG
ncbi:MAG: DUF1257 domain-containing protein [Planctomycetota bacterium]|jgi:hypothetical protein